MKSEIRAKTNVQLLCFGKILGPGEIYVHEGEIPSEVVRAKQQGLVTITEVKTPVAEPAKVAPKPVPKKVEKPKETIPETKVETKVEEPLPKEEAPEVIPPEDEAKPESDAKVDLDSLSTLSRPELDKVAVDLGLNPEEYSTVTKLRAAIRKKAQ